MNPFSFRTTSDLGQLGLAANRHLFFHFNYSLFCPFIHPTSSQFSQVNSTELYRFP